MRVVIWNLLHGGGRRVPRLAEALLAHEPDVCVLAEIRATTAPALLGLPAGDGLVHHAETGGRPEHPCALPGRAASDALQRRSLLVVGLS